jgi:predicted nucleic acid-binding Zn ribbon protein
MTCETNKEITRKFDDPEILPPCPNCGYSMSRVFNTFGIHFNGPGFYSTGG